MYRNGFMGKMGEMGVDVGEDVWFMFAAGCIERACYVVQTVQKTDVGTGRLRVHRKRHGKHGKWNGKTG